MAKRDLALDLFRSFQTGKRTREKTENRDVVALPTEPQPLSDLFLNLIKERQWKSGIAEGTLFSTWEDVVGVEIAQRTTPISLLDGVLVIQSSSTAWATQLRLVSPQILIEIQKSAPGALVESITVVGPQGPSWKRGLRTIRGAKGSRDTYG